MNRAYVIRGEPDRDLVAGIGAHTHNIPPGRIDEVIRRVACAANDRKCVLTNTRSAYSAFESEQSTHAMQVDWMLHIEDERYADRDQAG